MKTKILSMLLVLTLLLGAVAVLSSCGECEHKNLPTQWTKVNDRTHQRKCPDCEYTETKGHTYVTDQDKFNENPYAEMITKVCAACGDEILVANDVDLFTLEMENKTYPWQTTNLVMSVSNSANGGELESGGLAYVSGEWSLTSEHFKQGNTVTKVDGSVLNAINARNDASEAATNVTITYSYTGAAEKNWAEVMPAIEAETNADNTPDIYYNFIYDMVGASIKGFFSNIQGNEYLAPFYQSFSDETDDAGLASNVENTHGYNWDYMKDLSFSTKAMYLIASDYSFDLSRAYFIMPVSGTLLQNVADVTGDVNGDKIVGDAADFLAMVNAGGWTWTKIAEYAEAVKSPDSTKGGYSVNNSDCVAGFAMSRSGLCGTVVMYTGDVSIVTRSVKKGEYRYSYPRSTPQSMVDVFTMAQTYIHNLGAGSSTGEPGGTGGVVLYEGGTWLVNDMFAADRLFVNTACVLGVIESETYQNMWSTTNGGSGNGFIVTPAAKATDAQENYRTLVHNIGKVFAISAKATAAKVDAACAFINYQTVNSSSILVDYFVWSLGYGSAVNEENVEILTDMSNNLKYGIDKVVEDAIGILNKGTYIDDPFNAGKTIDAGEVRWHQYMATEQYDVGEQVTGLYDGVVGWKKDALTAIQEDFLKAAQ